MGKIIVYFSHPLIRIVKKEKVEIPVQGEMKIPELRQRIGELFPELRGNPLMGYLLFYTANRSLLDQDSSVKEGEQIHLLIPLMGG